MPRLMSVVLTEQAVVNRTKTVTRRLGWRITADDVRREGFRHHTPAWFVTFFCNTHRGAQPDTEVTVIRWRYLAESETP